MNKENQFEIQRGNFKTTLVFAIQDWNSYFEQEVEIGCGEDLSDFMKHYFKKDWKELFHGQFFDHKDVVDAEFKGIRIHAKDEKGSFWYEMESRERAMITINNEVLNDENANKIKQIRELIG
jgi:hypothetical protein